MTAFAPESFVRVAIVLGTRPEIVKLSPVVHDCQRRGWACRVIHTGQHYSRELDRVFFETLDLPDPDHTLEVGSGPHGRQTAKMLAGVEEILQQHRPDVLLVQGDTNSVLAGGLEVSAVDHHYTGESPRVVFVHFTGVGDEAAMATAVGKTFEAVKAKAAGAGPKLATLETAHKPLDAARLQAALPGGKLVDGVYQFSRARPAKVHGQAVGAEQGAASHADIAGSDDAAEVSGAFAAQGAEVQALLKAAAAQGLTVTSLDAPFANDAPHLVLVHFWGTGPSDKLARAVATGLAILK